VSDTRIRSGNSSEPQTAPDLGARPDKLGDAGSGGSLFDQVRQMHATEKFRLALKADRTTRAILLTDNDPRTLFFLCQNPHVSAEEILRICKDTRLLPSVVGYIVRNTQWIGREEIKHALVMNPKTPIPTALRLLPLLSRNNLRSLAKSQAVRQRIKQAALKLVIESPR
jgi:hypothetical protein